jgi:hypothetical protein
MSADEGRAAVGRDLSAPAECGFDGSSALQALAAHEAELDVVAEAYRRLQAGGGVRTLDEV